MTSVADGSEGVASNEQNGTQWHEGFPGGGGMAGEALWRQHRQTGTRRLRRLDDTLWAVE